MPDPDRPCTHCGTPNPPGPHFCATCGHYLGWESGTGAAREPGPSRAPGGTDAPTAVLRRRGEPPRTLPPTVAVADPDVRLDPVRGGTVELRVANPSTIVEGYRVEALAPPPWLAVAPQPIRLLPGEDDVVPIGLGIRSRTPVPAQSVRLRLRLLAESNGTIGAEVELTLTVPPVGGPATVRAEPALLRLQDAAHGRFRVHLDGRSANHPQRYVLAGSDDEGAVRFGFTPATVVVPAGGAAVVEVRFEVPPPRAGESVDRRLRVTATGDAASIETGVALAHRTSPADPSVRLRLEPTVLRTRDGGWAELDVVVDNRVGRHARRVVVGGRDAEQRVRFSFHPPTLTVAPGAQGRVRGRLDAALPAAGEEVVRPFTVWVRDGGQDAEETGTWVQGASAEALTTAHVALEPQHLTTRNAGSGRLRVALDNRRGSAPLRVRLRGTDPQGAVRFAFSPPTLDVAPGQVGWARLTVSAPRPDGGQEVERAFTVLAEDGRTAIEADGRFTQSSGLLRPKLRVLLTLLGALLVVAGAFLPWLAGDEDRPFQPTVVNVVDAVGSVVASPPPADVAGVGELVRDLQPAERALALAAAALMAFGLTGSRGRLTRVSSLVVVAAMTTVGAFWLIVGTGPPAVGAVVVVLGGICGYAGGLNVTR